MPNKMPKTLLQVSNNAKTVKGEKYGYLTGVLYMAPHTIAGPNVCPMATIAACDKACLYAAGRGAMSSVQLSRINKAQLFHSQREAFMLQLVKDVAKVKAKAIRKGMVPLIRLNGTSDIRWESIPVTVDGVTYPNIMAIYPDVQFYDYTKLANRKGIPANYDLTFSYSGVQAFQPFVLQAKANGMRIAVVFRNEQDIPESFMGMDCIGGDDSDIRHLEPQGVVVALYAKGPAKRDNTGFVVDVPERIIPIQLAA